MIRMMPVLLLRYGSCSSASIQRQLYTESSTRDSMILTALPCNYVKPKYYYVPLESVQY